MNGNGLSKLIKNPAVFIEVLVLIVVVIVAFTTIKIQAQQTETDLYEFKIETKEKLKEINTLNGDISEIKLNLKSFMASFDIEYQELD